MQQVAHAEGLLHVLVTVSVGDAALGGAELCAGLGQTCLFQTVLIDMVGMVMVARSEIFRLAGVMEIPCSRSLLISPSRWWGSMTIPLPITQTTLGRRIPEGSRFSTNLPRSFLTV